MVASTDIKFFVHTNNNAPQLQNAFGSMINVLDAALVNGIQVGTVSSLTTSGKIVTAVFGTAHNLMPYQVVKIAGANQAEYNGEYRILSVPNATTLTFELAEVPSTTIATGTINCSLPPLGWEKPFSSNNPNGGGKAAYRSKNLLLPSRPFLRVVDELDPAYTATYAKYAKVGIVEDMTDIDTMLGVQAPFDSAAPNKNWVGTGSGTSAINGWAKWYYARSRAATSSAQDTNSPDSGNRPWMLVGNGDYFYFFPSTIPENFVASAYGFGSYNSLLNTDSSNTFLSAAASNTTASTSTTPRTIIGSSLNNTADLFLQRGYAQNAIYTTANLISLHVASIPTHSGTSNYIGDQSLANVVPFAPVFINESVLRGELLNIYYVFQIRPYGNLTIVEKNSVLYIAKNITSSGVEGQIMLKIGEL